MGRPRLGDIDVLRPQDPTSLSALGRDLQTSLSTPKAQYTTARGVCVVADSYAYCCHGPCHHCRELERQQRAADKGFVHNSSAAAKRKRARVFAAWLVQQYGKERLSAGSGVLDVAGRGKAEQDGGAQHFVPDCIMSNERIGAYQNWVWLQVHT